MTLRHGCQQTVNKEEVVCVKQAVIMSGNQLISMTHDFMITDSDVNQPFYWQHVSEL